MNTFNGDTGAGLGASHQTGWTGLVAKLIQQQGDSRHDYEARSVHRFVAKVQLSERQERHHRRMI